MILMPPVALLRAELEGAGIACRRLVEELGPLRAAAVLGAVAAAQAAGEPWRKTGRPAGRRDALSRRQLAAAVLLERTLRRHTSAQHARDITSSIVLESSVRFLSMNVPVLKKDEILAMPERERKRHMRRIQDRFFNADAKLELIGEERLVMTVTRCRFVELLGEIGEADMAPMFCEGDKVFFEQHQPEVIFERPETLSGGGSCCDFRFSWK